jgi:hypothetical protein
LYFCYHDHRGHPGSDLVLLAAWAMALTPPDANYAPMNYEPAAAAAFDREKSNPDSNRCVFARDSKQTHNSICKSTRVDFCTFRDPSKVAQQTF